MAVADVLDLTGYNFPVTREAPPGVRTYKADSGYQMSELVTAPAWRWNVNLLGRTWADLKPLIAWFTKMKASVEPFTLYDAEWNRKFTVRLISAPRFESEMSELSDSAIVLEEQIGYSLLEYPTSPSIFIEETSGIAVGAWSSQIGLGRPLTGGGTSTVLQTTTANDYWTADYPGYGFRLWATGTSTVQIYLDGDLLASEDLTGQSASTPAYTNYSIPLDVHVIRVKAGTGTTNIDALEFVYSEPL